MLVRAIDPKANVRAVEPDTSNRDYDDRRAAAEEFLEGTVGGPGADLGRRVSEYLGFVAPGKSGCIDLAVQRLDTETLSGA